MNIDDTGFWIGDPKDLHKHDDPLCAEITKVLKEKNIRTLLDLGCGNGLYAKYFEEHGIAVECCDGNPITFDITQGKCFVENLAQHVNFKKTYNCVLSLEVGEHLPKEYEEIFIDNVVRHSENFIILSWALPHQGGHGHFNEQTNEYIAEKFAAHGFSRDTELEERLRASAFWWWFKHTIMVFYR